MMMMMKTMCFAAFLHGATGSTDPAKYNVESESEDLDHNPMSDADSYWLDLYTRITPFCGKLRAKRDKSTHWATLSFINTDEFWRMSPKDLEDRAIDPVFAKRHQQLHADFDRLNATFPGISSVQIELLKSILIRYTKLELFSRMMYKDSYFTGVLPSHPECSESGRSPLPAYQQANKYGCFMLMDAFKNDPEHEDKILEMFTYYMLRMKESNEKHYERHANSETQKNYSTEEYHKVDITEIVFGLVKEIDEPAEKAFRWQVHQAQNVVVDGLPLYRDSVPSNLTKDLMKLRDEHFYDKPMCRRSLFRFFFSTLLGGCDYNHAIYCSMVKFLPLLLTNMRAKITAESKQTLGPCTIALDAIENYQTKLLNVDFTALVQRICAAEKKETNELHAKRKIQNMAYKRLKEKKKMDREEKELMEKNPEEYKKLKIQQMRLGNVWRRIRGSSRSNSKLDLGMDDDEPKATVADELDLEDLFGRR